jgi:HAD superfamily hydrolase (TIGR01509 family)
METDAIIQAVIFDIGGVLVRTDDPEPRTNLARRYGFDRNGLEHLVFGSPIAEAVECGQGKEADVWRHISETLNLNTEQLQEFRHDFWVGDHLDGVLFEFLASLRPRFKTALLSNNWSVDLLPLFWGRFGLPMDMVLNTFDAAVSSAAVGATKPDPRIYQHTLDLLHVEPNRSVFVDDFIANVEGARRVGMHAILFESTDQIYRDLSDLLGV